MNDASISEHSNHASPSNCPLKPAELNRHLSSFDELPPLRDSLIINNRSYRQQFANLYFVRLTKLRPSVLKAAELRWKNIPQQPTYVNKVLDVQPGEICYIIGTIYMDMPLKPNILDDITKEHWIAEPPPRAKYISDNDKVALEDESGRVLLTGEILKKENMITGIIVGVLGSETPAGEFEVIDLCLPGLAPQIPFNPMETNNKDKGDKYIALISGLNISTHDKVPLERQMMIEYLTGELGSSDDQLISSRITRTVVVGNSIASYKVTEDDKKRKKFGYDFTLYDSTPLTMLDDILQELGSTIELDLMPGEHDPSNAQIPQQPLHFAMFPKASALETFRTVTNPYWFNIDGITFLATSGQTIDDIYKYVDGDNRLELAERTLFWQHIAPSAPDTLWCYPFTDKDPLITPECPHVYIIGNQNQFATSVVQGADGQKARVILLPSFSETASIVLVNIRTLECHPVSFKSSFDPNKKI